MTKKTALYVDCGLDNVQIHNVDVMMDDAGNHVYEIPNIVGLHRAISIAILSPNRSLRPKEIRFLRTECGWTQAYLASMLNMDAQSIGRWERGDTPVDFASDVVMRLAFSECLEIDNERPISEMLEDCGPILGMHFLDIDGRDPSNYVPIFDKVA